MCILILRRVISRSIFGRRSFDCWFCFWRNGIRSAFGKGWKFVVYRSTVVDVYIDGSGILEWTRYSLVNEKVTFAS